MLQSLHPVKCELLEWNMSVCKRCWSEKQVFIKWPKEWWCCWEDGGGETMKKCSVGYLNNSLFPSCCIWLFTSIKMRTWKKNIKQYTHKNEKGCTKCRKIKVFVCLHAAMQVSDYEVLLGSRPLQQTPLQEGCGKDWTAAVRRYEARRLHHAGIAYFQCTRFKITFSKNNNPRGPGCLAGLGGD